ncbi:MAG: RNA-binding protein [Hyphomicrobium sp.]
MVENISLEKRGAEENIFLESRLCALTQKSLPREELIRFVVGPDQQIFPDVSAKLPGRGIWITATAEKITEAISRGVFNRSLKREIKIPPDLPLKTGSLLQERALNALSLANKAGQVTTGFVQVEKIIKSGKVALLLHAKDGSQGGAEKLDKLMKAVCQANDREAQIETFFTVEQMSLALGGLNVVHAALTKNGATQKFINEANRMQRYFSLKTA